MQKNEPKKARFLAGNFCLRKTRAQNPRRYAPESRVLTPLFLPKRGPRFARHWEYQYLLCISQIADWKSHLAQNFSQGTKRHWFAMRLYKC